MRTISIFGKNMPIVAIIVAVLVIGTASAALLNNYGQLQSDINVERAIVVDGYTGPDEIPLEYEATVFGGETDIITHTVENMANSVRDIEITTDGNNEGIDVIYTTAFLKSRDRGTTGEGDAEPSSVELFYPVTLEAYGNNNDGAEGTLVIPAPMGMTLSDLDNVSWDSAGVTGYTPHVDIIVELLNGDTTALTAEGILNGGGYTFPDDNLGFGSEPNDIVDNNTLFREYNVVEDLTLEQWQNGDSSLTPINGDSPIVRIEIEVDNWIVSSSAIVDNVKVNGIENVYEVIVDTRRIVNKEQLPLLIVYDVDDLATPTTYTITSTILPADDE